MDLSRREWLKGATALAAVGASTAFYPAFAQQPAAAKSLVIDCHGHYTTEPKALLTFRQAQIAALKDSRPSR